MGGPHVDKRKTINDSQADFFFPSQIKNSLTRHCEAALPITICMWKGSCSVWNPVVKSVAVMSTNLSWGQAVVWRSMDPHCSSIWFMKFLNKLKELPDLQWMSWFRKGSDSMKSSERIPPLTFALKVVSSQIVGSEKQTRQCFICISTGTCNRATMTSLRRKARRKSSAGTQCCLQTEQKGKILGVWVSFEGLFALTVSWLGSIKYGTKEKQLVWQSSICRDCSLKSNPR